MGSFILLTPGFPANEDDTTCLPAFQQFALSVKKQNPSLNFIIVSLQYPYQKKEYYWNGIRIISLGGSNKSGISRLYIWIKAYLLLGKLHCQEKIIGILSLWVGECAYVGKYFSNKHHIKHFIWLIGQDAKKENKFIQRIKPHAADLIAMSDFLQEEFLKNHGIKPLHIIENGIREDIFPAFNTADRPIDIFGAGSLSDLKNYDLFIEVVFEIKKVKPTVTASIAGEGEKFEHLQQKIISLGLQNNIQLLGSKSHQETLSLMSQSKTFLHTSHFEGNSTVLVEALYSGCFVCSTQPLSKRPIKNLSISIDKQEMVQFILQFLMEPTSAEKIIFNTMDNSVQKMMKLFSV